MNKRQIIIIIAIIFFTGLTIYKIISPQSDIQINEKQNQITIDESAEQSREFQKRFLINSGAFSSYVEYYSERENQRLVIETPTGKQLVEEIEQNRGGCCRFEDKKFSRDHKYLYYKIFNYDGNQSKVYNLEEDKVVLNIPTPDSYGFSWQSEYFFACSYRQQKNYGKIYSLPDFKILFDLENLDIEKPYTVSCYAHDQSYPRTIQFSITDVNKKIEFIDYDIDTDEITRKEKEIERPFGHLDSEMFQIDTTDIQVSEGFEIVNSILSNQGDKVIFSEMKQLATNDPYRYNLEYNVKIENLNTGEQVNVYSYPQKKTSGLFNNLFINKAQAGGSLLLYFPRAWTPNDEKIIMRWIGPNATGSGGHPEYSSFTVDPNNGEITSLTLSMWDYIFSDDYSYVIKTVATKNSHAIDWGMGGIVNFGSIVIKNIETGEEKVLIAEDNSYYRLKNIDSDILTYTRQQTIDNPNDDRFGKLDDSFPEEKKTISIKYPPLPLSPPPRAILFVIFY